MRNLYKFHWDQGRMGRVESLFVATPEEVQGVIGKEVYFGEILGKHSEVYGVIEEGEIKLVSDDQEKIDWLVTVTGAEKEDFLDVPSESITITGHNPLQYLRDDGEDAEGEES